jgi:D-beta-D-heptose 7-phosphate kinase/D-beta-D-heptose 1-phosphate adenosyltransferase
MLKKIKETINLIKEQKILVIGDSILDEYRYGNTSRISPEAPVPIINIEKTEYALGGAANVANNLKALGVKNVYLSTLVESGWFGRKMKKLLNKKDINTSLLVQNSDRPTTVKTRIIVQGQHVIRIDKEVDNPVNEKTVNKIISQLTNILADINLIIVSDYNKGLVTPKLSQRIIQLSNKNNIKVVIDPKGQNYMKYKNAYCVMPNFKEFQKAMGVSLNKKDDLNPYLKKFKEKLKLATVIVTLGDAGMVSLDNSKLIKINAPQVKVVDITGAGDTAISVVSLCLLTGLNLKDILKVATAACGIVIGKQGTATLNQKELYSKLIDEV